MNAARLPPRSSKLIMSTAQSSYLCPTLIVNVTKVNAFINSKTQIKEQSDSPCDHSDNAGAASAMIWLMRVIESRVIEASSGLQRSQRERRAHSKCLSCSTSLRSCRNSTALTSNGRMVGEGVRLFLGLCFAVTQRLDFVILTIAVGLSSTLRPSRGERSKQHRAQVAVIIMSASLV